MRGQMSRARGERSARGAVTAAAVAVMAIAGAACKGKSSDSGTATPADPESPASETQVPDTPSGDDREPPGMIVGTDATRRPSASTGELPERAVARLVASDGLAPDYGADAPPWAMRFAGDDRVVAWYLDGAIRVWEVGASAQVLRIHVLDDATRRIEDVALSADGAHMYVATNEPRVLQLRAADGGAERELTELPDDVPVIAGDGGVALSQLTLHVVAAGDVVIAAGEGAVVLNAADLTPRGLLSYDYTADRGPGVASCIGVSEDGRRLGWLDEINALQVFDVATGEQLARMRAPGGPWSGAPECAFSGDMSIAAAAGGGVLAFRTAKPNAPAFEDTGADRFAVVVDRAGKRLAFAGGADGEDVTVVELGSGRRLATWRACDDGQIDAIAIRPDGARLATTCGTAVVVWAL